MKCAIVLALAAVALAAPSETVGNHHDALRQQMIDEINNNPKNLWKVRPTSLIFRISTTISA